MDEMLRYHLPESPAAFLTKDDFARIQKRRGAHLPHWTANAAVYHVIFRLHDSIPQTILAELAAERERLRHKLSQPGNRLTAHERRILGLQYSEMVDRYLDAGHGSCRLKDARIADLVANALTFFEGSRYTLFAWCVMPNHVHVVVQPIGNHTLPDILHSWKSYSSKLANRMLGATGKFWREEYFDRILRDDEELGRTIEYVFENPGKVGFSSWRWRGKKE